MTAPTPAERAELQDSFDVMLPVIERATIERCWRYLWSKGWIGAADDLRALLPEGGEE